MRLYITHFNAPLTSHAAPAQVLRHFASDSIKRVTEQDLAARLDYGMQNQLQRKLPILKVAGAELAHVPYDILPHTYVNDSVSNYGAAGETEGEKERGHGRKEAGEREQRRKREKERERE